MFSKWAGHVFSKKQITVVPVPRVSKMNKRIIHTHTHTHTQTDKHIDLSIYGYLNTEVF